MSKATMGQLDAFYELSSALTDFAKVDLLGAGVGQEYLDELVRGAGEKQVKDLLAAAKKAGSSTPELRKRIWDDDRLGPMARNIVLMWYLGSWFPLSDDWHERFRPDFERVPEHVVSAVAYQEALWSVAVGAHPRGAKPPGFGSWGEEPKVAVRDAKRLNRRRSGQKRTTRRKTGK